MHGGSVILPKNTGTVLRVECWGGHPSIIMEMVGPYRAREREYCGGDGGLCESLFGASSRLGMATRGRV